MWQTILFSIFYILRQVVLKTTLTIYYNLYGSQYYEPWLITNNRYVYGYIMTHYYNKNICIDIIIVKFTQIMIHNQFIHYEIC